VEDVDRGLRSLKPTTGVGTEFCGPREWLRLPRAARAELAAILNLVERKAAWPWQALESLIHLAAQPGKPKDRALGCISMLARLHSRIRKPYTDDWCDARAGFWDEAIRGSSPLPGGAEACFDRRGVLAARCHSWHGLL
jgi:hypothetical protein